MKHTTQLSGAKQLQQIAASRKESALLILATPEAFKQCRSCQSLVADSVVFCPFCKAYGFDSELEQIIAMATMLGDRTLSFGCGVLPRGTSVRAHKRLRTEWQSTTTSF